MNIHLGIIFSLGLNAVLVGGVVKELNSKSAGKAADVSVESRVMGLPAAAKSERATPALVVIDTPAEPFHWKKLESEDYRQYVANLRAIKCPEQTIQDIVYADLERLLAKKFRAVNVKYKINRDNTSSDYWKSDVDFTLAKYERDAEGRKVHDERREALIALLGMDAEQQRRQRLGLAEFDGTVYPFLNTREMAAIRDVWAEIKVKEALANQKYGGYQGPEIREEFRQLALERDEATSKALSPQEKEEWMLRVSHVSTLMRSSLSAFEPNEQEFRALYKLEYDQYLKIGPYAYMGSVDPDDLVAAAQKQETQKLKDAAIRTLLGEERYREYSMSQSYDFKQLYQVAQSKEAATQVYQLKQATEAELGKLATNPTLTPEAKQQAMATVQQAASQAVQQVLGQQNYQRYEMTGGRWLRPSSPVGVTRGSP